jgi:hypothetical protein
MSKEEGAKTVVLGGRKGVQQEYCGKVLHWFFKSCVNNLDVHTGTVGGQSTDFTTIDGEVKVRRSYTYLLVTYRTLQSVSLACRTEGSSTCST